MAFYPGDKAVRKPWWKKLFAKLLKPKAQTNQSSVNVDISNQTTLKEWQQMLDMLQPLVRSMRNEIDELNINELSFDILGAGTFLLQIDLLLIKVRQHFNNYERRHKELDLSGTQLDDILSKVVMQCRLCYVNMRDLYAMLRARTYRDLNNKDIISQVQSLEFETKALTECMHSLNEMALKQDPLYQLFEHELFKTMMELEQTPKPNSELTISSTNTATLRDKAHGIMNPDLRKIAFNLISYYESLRRCSILYQSPQVTKSLDAFKMHMKDYLNQSCEAITPDVTALQASIHGIFCDLESMRFTRFKGYQEKACTIKRQLQQTLKQSEFGIACLKTLQMSPRAKLSLRSKFN